MSSIILYSFIVLSFLYISDGQRSFFENTNAFEMHSLQGKMYTEVQLCICVTDNCFYFTKKSHIAFFFSDVQ